MIVNHVGLRVADLERSVAFYRGLGFESARDLAVPDAGSARLLGLEPPIGLRAHYLVNGPFVLELLGFAPEQPARAELRSITDVGLTHLSIGVDDIAEAIEAVVAYGGEVLAETHVGVAVMVRDPDGQLLELLVAAHRPVTPGE